MKKILIIFAVVFTSQAFAVYYSTEDVRNNPISLENTADNPYDQFFDWYSNAKKDLGEFHSRSAFLATASTKGIPSGRMVSVRILDNNEIAFFGDSRSLKMQQLEKNPYVAICFYWYESQRQVIISGKVKQVSRSVAQKVFDMRNKESQISSHASHQGQTMNNRGELLNKHQDVADKYKYKRNLPTPDHWVGYIIEPECFVFWQAGPAIMHSVVRFSKAGVEYLPSKGSKWKKELVQP